MTNDTRLQDLLGIDHPIIQAPMAGASTPAMAAAASNAGALGSLGCAMATGDGLRSIMEEMAGLTNRPVNYNFFCHKEPELDEIKGQKAHGRSTEGFFFLHGTCSHI